MHDTSPSVAEAGQSTRASGRLGRLRLIMVGLDHKTADITAREHFTVSAEAMPAFLRRLREMPRVAGCAYLSTCNRSELYLSYTGDLQIDAAALLCAAMDIDVSFADLLTERVGAAAVRHIMRVAGGLEASVPGDDQVITQVRDAVEAAREADTADPQLQTLFRLAVTAGKRIRTKARFNRDGDSVAGAAVRAIATHLGGIHGKRAMVIGNGVIGRLAASLLLAEGCRVAMTRRTHRPGRPAMPDGCEAVEFADRLDAMAGCDVVVSATSSPHFTVTAADFATVPQRPNLVVDLAIPRDVEPDVAALPGVTLWNVDNLKQESSDNDARRTLLAEEIIDEEAARFEMWRHNRLLHRRRQKGRPDFPAFINLHGQTALVVGGGLVAARRTEVLLNFGARVRLIAPDIGPEMHRLLDREGLLWRQRGYDTNDLEGVTLAVAATDDRDLNFRIGQEAKESAVLVSVADKREECSFYFPAIIRSENLTAGLVSNDGRQHHLVKKAAARLRQELEQIDEDFTGGKQGE
ncbi:MAG: glutamyl-tRNA reductase [Planctomycetaceae bacterium]|nr:glutamyl-tRNA reductase [Planctomycetaceae bacterium]